MELNVFLDALNVILDVFLPENKKQKCNRENFEKILSYIKKLRQNKIKNK